MDAQPVKKQQELWGYLIPALGLLGVGIFVILREGSAGFAAMLIVAALALGLVGFTRK